MLSIAIIHTIDNRERKYKCQALLNQGSQVNTIRTSLAQRLRFPNLPNFLIYLILLLSSHFRISYSRLIPYYLIITLADLQFWVPRDIDLIIDNDQLWDIMCMEQHRLEKNL
ncbi:hypothetical protein APICC_01456 [Apis cerana cerana]|uniref:Uncharacterized protein n=1 Tax=Apis cerana cerana TaxID=94128 RepID=A0A2A3E4F1_APICC|nr:hypothetical protein APICC_01456 [Apis cerana cerana]